MDWRKIEPMWWYAIIMAIGSAIMILSIDVYCIEQAIRAKGFQR